MRTPVNNLWQVSVSTLADGYERERQWGDADAEPMLEEVLSNALFSYPAHPRPVLIYKGKRNVAETSPSWLGPLYTVHSLSVLSKLTCNSSLRRHNDYLIRVPQQTPIKCQRRTAFHCSRTQYHGASWPSKCCTWVVDSSLTILLKYHQVELPDCWIRK